VTERLRWPLETTTRNGATTHASVRQGSLEEVRRGHALLCELRPGQLPWARNLGIPDPLATVDPDASAAAIEAAIADVDPRIPAHIDVIDTPSGRRLRLRITTPEG